MRSSSDAGNGELVAEIASLFITGCSLPITSALRSTGPTGAPVRVRWTSSSHALMSKVTVVTVQKTT